MAGQAVAPPAGAEGQALIEEARQRHRRRRRWIVLAVAIAVVAGVAVAAGLGGGQAGRHPPGVRAHPRMPPAAGRVLPGARTTLITWPAGSCCEAGTKVYVDDLGRGRLALRLGPPIGGGDIPYILEPVSRWLVYNGGGGVAAVRDDLTGRPRLLGRATFFVPSAVPGQVLLVNHFRNTVRPVEVSSGRVGPAVRLPKPAGELLAGTDRGFLLLSRGDALELWRPGGAPQAIAALGRFGQGLGFAMNRRIVTYATGCTDVAVTSTRSGWESTPVGYSVCQVLRVIDLVSGRRLAFAAPPGTLGWASYGGPPGPADSAIAPGNGLLAAPAAVAPASDGTVRLFVLRLGRPGAAPLAVPRSAGPGYAVSTWSSSSWLFYEGPGGKVQAFQLKTRRSADLGIPCRQCMAMVTVPG
jgi:hypothetical protein